MNRLGKHLIIWLMCFIDSAEIQIPTSLMIHRGADVEEIVIGLMTLVAVLYHRANLSH